MSDHRGDEGSGVVAVVERRPLALRAAVIALASCVAATAALLIRNRVHQPSRNVGRRLTLADDTAATVYRETVVDRAATASPAVLVVGFRLRKVRSDRAHALFRLESVLNTVLFVGFPGFVSKLWLSHDDNGLYRGVYEWDDPARAEAYVRALWWVLALVSEPSSIHYAILPGLRRDQLLDDPSVADRFAPEDARAWWRLRAVDGERA